MHITFYSIVFLCPIAYNNLLTLFFRVTFLESYLSYAFVEKKSTFTFTVQNMTGQSGKVNFDKQGSSFLQLLYGAE